MKGEFFRDSAPTPVEAVWGHLRDSGCVVVSDEQFELGAERSFGKGFRDHVEGAWFNGGKLYRDPYGIPPHDRERARGVFRYDWQGGRLRVAPHTTADIGRRSYTDTSVRHYPNMAPTMLGDPVFKHWPGTALTLIPPELRDQQSTFGVNLFRTHTDVVAGPHRDDEKFVLVYVVDKHGDGAESDLYEEDASTPFYTTTLNPGDFILFDDQRFLHSASKLEPEADGVPPYRDTVVCTFNKPETYRI